MNGKFSLEINERQMVSCTVLLWKLMSTKKLLTELNGNLLYNISANLVSYRCMGCVLNVMNIMYF